MQTGRSNGQGVSRQEGAFLLTSGFAPLGSREEGGPRPRFMREREGGLGVKRGTVQWLRGNLIFTAISGNEDFPGADEESYHRRI